MSFPVFGRFDLLLCFFYHPVNFLIIDLVHFMLPFGLLVKSRYLILFYRKIVNNLLKIKRWEITNDKKTRSADCQPGFYTQFNFDYLEMGG